MLAAGLDYGDEDYVIFSGVTGTWPGFTLSGIDVPLSLDDWTWVAFANINSSFLVDFMGRFDSSGRAMAKLNTHGGISLELIGLAMYFDYLVLESSLTLPLKTASQPVQILFIP